MASIDERIVSMVFDNAKFEAGVSKTMSTLGKLDASLKNMSGHKTAFHDLEQNANTVTFEKPMSALQRFKSALGSVGSGAKSVFSGMSNAFGAIGRSGIPTRALDIFQSRLQRVPSTAQKTFSDIERESGQVRLSGLTSALDNVSHRFSIVRGAAAVALGGIAQRAAMAGVNVVKSLTLTPVMEGFHNYETQINAVQTILANTGLKGKKGLDQVTGSLNELNKYANLTVYNFSEMARNIGTFTAAGVKLAPATAAIKGIANLGALSGSNADQVSRGMYQLSQAIAAGKVGLQDWNSVVNAGMGGLVFQKALANTAGTMGTLSGRAVEFNKATNQLRIGGESFRESMAKGPGKPPPWLTSSVLVNTLKQFTGDMTDAQLKAQGFSKAQIKAIQDQAKLAVQSATQIKTVTQLFEALKEEVGTAWATVFKTIFGNINQAKNILSPLHTAIENFLTIPIYKINTVLQGWSKLGGRTLLIDALKQGVKDLGMLLKPVVQAFHDIFPPTTGNSLFKATQAFSNLVKALQPSKQTMIDLRHVFEGVFAVLHIGIAIIKESIGLILRLIGHAGQGSGTFLHFAGSIGEFLKHLDQMLIKGGELHKFFDTLYNIASGPLSMLRTVVGAIAGLFSGKSDTSGITAGMHAVTSAATPLGRALGNLKNDWSAFLDVMDRIKQRLQPVFGEITHAFSVMFQAIGQAFSHENFNRTLAAIQTAFMGGIFIALRKFVVGGVTDLGAALASPLKNINNVLGGLTKQLRTMQQAIKAKMIIEIAASIGILAAAVFLLATLDPGRLSASMTAIAVGLGELMGSMQLLTRGMGTLKGGFNTGIAAQSMIAMAGAVLILSFAMKRMSTLSWKEIARGTAGIAGGLIAVGDGMRAMGPGLLVKGPALIGIAVALNVLYFAVKQFSGLSWKELAHGLAGVLGTLTAVAAPLTAVGPSLILVGPGLAVVAGALLLLADVVKTLGKMDPRTLLTGLSAIIVALGGIALAVSAIPPTIIVQAAGVTVVAFALGLLADALKKFGSMSLESIYKSLITVGGAIVVLGTGLMFMSGTVLGTAALMGAAVALTVLAPALALLGQLSIPQIAVGLLAIAGVLGVLAAVGTVAFEGLFLLGGALLPLAAAFTVAAKGVLWFVQAFKVFTAIGVKGIGVMMTAFTAAVAVLPNIAIQFAKGLVAVAEGVAAVAPKVVNAMVAILNSIAEAIAKSSPKLSVAMGVLVDSFMAVLLQNGPKIENGGELFFISLLKGLNKHLPEMMDSGAQLMITFADGVAKHARQVVNAGAHAVVVFLDAISSRARRVVGAGIHIAASFLNGIAQHIGEVYHAGANIILNILAGIADNAKRIVTKATEIAGRFIRALARGLVHLADVGGQAIIDLLNGMARVTRKRAPEIRKAGWNLASAMIDGMLGGFSELWHKVTDKITGLAHHLPSWFRKPLGIGSPSKVFHEMGGNLMEGLANGISAGGSDVEKSMRDTVDTVTHAARKTLPNLFAGMEKKNPVITPILDLTHVKKGAKEIGRLTQTSPIMAQVALEHASAISRDKAAIDASRADAASKMQDLRPNVKFEQHNHSPEPLSTAEIYRRTNNQMSQIKKAVGLHR